MKKFLAILIIFAMLVSPVLMFNVAAEDEEPEGDPTAVVADGDEDDGAIEGVVPIGAEIDADADEDADEPEDGEDEDDEDEPEDAEEDEEEEEEGEQTATLSLHTFIIKGIELPLPFPAYNINGNNYFKLRDIAAALQMAATLGLTDKCFGVEWSEEEMSVYLTSGEAYVGLGTELQLPKEPRDEDEDELIKEPRDEDELIKEPRNEDKITSKSTHKVYLDEELVEWKAYLIDDANYFMLRDILKALDIGVDFEETDDGIIVTIDLEAGYEEDGEDADAEDGEDEDADAEDDEDEEDDEDADAEKAEDGEDDKEGEDDEKDEEEKDGETAAE